MSDTNTKKDFLDIIQLNPDELNQMLERAKQLKQWAKQNPNWNVKKKSKDHIYKIAGEQLHYRNPIMVGIFEKPSTRTRVSFDLAMNLLSGQFIYLSGGEMQLGSGETIEDTARVLSRMADIIMIRTYGHDNLLKLAKTATIPVINGLTDFSHPCQIMAGLLTLQEEFGELTDLKLAWVGDGNNTCRSWLEAALVLNLPMAMAMPKGYEPYLDDLKNHKNFKNLTISHDPTIAVKNAHVVITDAWTSMNHTNRAERLKDFKGYSITADLMKLANEQAIFSHCLPAHRGEEVMNEVIDSPASRVWDEAENRIHAQMAIIDWLLT